MSFKLFKPIIFPVYTSNSKYLQYIWSTEQCLAVGRLPNYWPPTRAVRGWEFNISAEDAKHWIGLLHYNPSTAAATILCHLHSELGSISWRLFSKGNFCKHLQIFLWPPYIYKKNFPYKRLGWVLNGYFSLKVPSHKIRLGWKWYGSIDGIDGIDGKKIFKCCLHFFILI